MYQTIPIPLGTVSFSAGGQATLDFSALQPQIAGRIPHLRHITFDTQITPTLSSGSVKPLDLQKAVKSLVLQDGVRTLFQGSFASLRGFEVLENGRVTSPENDVATTGQAVNYQRVWNAGPLGLASLTDFVMPAACYRGGSMQFGFGALTDVSANCTALTATITVVAHVALHDELIFGSLYERREQLVSNGVSVGQEALYAYAGFAKASTFSTFSAGDVASLSIDFLGYSTKPVHVAALERAFHSLVVDGGVGGYGQSHGEPRAATDVNPKVFNGTAIAAADSTLIPAIWTERLAKITKLVYAASPAITFNWTGTASSLYGMLGRIVPKDSTRIGSYAALVEQALGLRVKTMDARTLSKAPYNGPRRAYLPNKAKVA